MQVIKEKLDCFITKNTILWWKKKTQNKYKAGADGELRLPCEKEVTGTQN